MLIWKKVNVLKQKKAKNSFFRQFLEKVCLDLAERPRKASYFFQVNFVTMNLVYATTRPNSGFKAENHIPKNYMFGYFEIFWKDKKKYYLNQLLIVVSIRFMHLYISSHVFS